MPWLEVPDWRAWQPYAHAMSDTPDETPTTFTVDDAPAEPVVITGSIDMTIDPLDFGLAPPLDDVLAGNNDSDDDEGDSDDEAELARALEEHPSGRFPVESVAEPVEIAGVQHLASAPTVDHRPATADETDDERKRRIEKESMSRGERRRRGW